MVVLTWGVHTVVDIVTIVQVSILFPQSSDNMQKDIMCHFQLYQAVLL